MPMHATPLWNRSSYHFTRGTAVPIPIDQGNSSSYTSPRGTAVPSNSPGKQWFLYQFTKGTVVPTNSPKEQWFLQLHQRNSGSYIHCGNSGSCIFAKGATFPTNSQWNSGSHERGIAVSKKIHQGNRSSHQLNTTVHVVTASLFKEQRFLCAGSAAGPL